MKKKILFVIATGFVAVSALFVSNSVNNNFEGSSLTSLTTSAQAGDIERTRILCTESSTECYIYGLYVPGMRNY